MIAAIRRPAFAIPCIAGLALGIAAAPVVFTAFAAIELFGPRDLSRRCCRASRSSIRRARHTTCAIDAVGDKIFSSRSGTQRNSHVSSLQHRCLDRSHDRRHSGNRPNTARARDYAHANCRRTATAPDAAHARSSHSGVCHR
jgi:hypothetical protein